MLGHGPKLLGLADPGSGLPALTLAWPGVGGPVLAELWIWLTQSALLGLGPSWPGHSLVLVADPGQSWPAMARPDWASHGELTLALLGLAGRELVMTLVGSFLGLTGPWIRLTLTLAGLTLVDS